MNEIDPSVILQDGDCIYFRGVKYQRVEKLKPITLYEIIADWWDEIFINSNPSGQNIETLVDQIEEWLPDEVEYEENELGYNQGWNDCLDKIKGKLR
jgi:hypothetical protein